MVAMMQYHGSRFKMRSWQKLPAQDSSLVVKDNSKSAVWRATVAFYQRWYKQLGFQYFMAIKCPVNILKIMACNSLTRIVEGR